MYAGSDRGTISVHRAAGGEPLVLRDLSKDELARELVREVEEILLRKRAAKVP